MRINVSEIMDESGTKLLHRYVEFVKKEDYLKMINLLNWDERFQMVERLGKGQAKLFAQMILDGEFNEKNIK